MLERRWSEVCVDHRAWLVLDLNNPLAKLSSIRDCRRQEHILDSTGQHDNGLLPDHASLFVAHVVDLVEDDPSHFSGDLAAVVKHASEDLSGHDKARCTFIDGNITCHEADIFKLFLKLTILLVAKSLDRRCVNDALLSFE